MKRLLAMCLLLISLCGCKTSQSQMDQALMLRQNLLKSQGCSFSATISADYQDALYTFVLRCESDWDAQIKFSVLQPEPISGITGTVSAKGGKLTFDDKVLAFPLLADGLLSPVSAPWIFLQSLRSGYIKSCGNDGDGMIITINDTYASESICIDIYTDSNSLPKHVDIFWQGRRILSMDITDFVYV